MGLAFFHIQIGRRSICSYGTDELGKISSFDHEELKESDDLESKISRISSEYSVSQQNTSLLVLHNSTRSVLIPEALFLKDQAEEYLKFNAAPIYDGLVAYDVMAAQQMVNVYSLENKTKSLLDKKFSNISHQHYATALLDLVLKNKPRATDYSTPQVLIDNSQKDFSRIIVLQGDKLLLHNTFCHDTPEFFLYYLECVFSEFKIKAREIYELKSFSTNLSKDMQYAKEYGFEVKTWNVSVATATSITDIENVIML